MSSSHKKQLSSHKHQNSQQFAQANKITASKGYMGSNGAQISKYDQGIASTISAATHTTTKFGSRKNSQPCLKISAFSKTSGRLFSPQNQKIQNKAIANQRAQSNSPQQMRQQKLHQQQQQYSNFYANNNRRNDYQNYSDVKQPKNSTVRSFIPTAKAGEERATSSKRLQLYRNQDYSPHNYQITSSNIRNTKHGDFFTPASATDAKKFRKGSNKNDSITVTTQSHIDISNTASKKGNEYLSSSQHNSKPINPKNRKSSLSNYPSANLHYGGGRATTSGRPNKKTMTDVLMKVTNPNNFVKGKQKLASPTREDDCYGGSSKTKIKKAKQTYFSNQRSSEPFLGTGLKMHFPGSINNIMQIDLVNGNVGGSSGGGGGSGGGMTPGSVERINANFQALFKDSSMNRGSNHHQQQQQQQQQQHHHYQHHQQSSQQRTSPNNNANLILNDFKIGNDSSRNSRQAMNNNLKNDTSKFDNTKNKRPKKATSSNTVFLPNNFGSFSPSQHHRTKTPPGQATSTRKENQKRGRSQYQRTSSNNNTQNLETSTDGRMVRKLNMQVHQLIEQKEQLVNELKRKDIQIQNLMSTRESSINGGLQQNRRQNCDEQPSPSSKSYLKNAPNSFIRLNKSPEIATGQGFQFYKNQSSQQSKLNDNRGNRSDWHSSSENYEQNRDNQHQRHLQNQNQLHIKTAPKTDIRNHHYNQHHHYQQQFNQSSKRYIVRKVSSPGVGEILNQDGSIQSQKITKSLRKYHNNKMMGATGEMWPSTTTNQSRSHGKRKIHQKKATTGQYSASISGAKTNSIGISSMGGLFSGGLKDIQSEDIKQDKNQLDNMKGRVFTVLRKYQQRVKDLRDKVSSLQKQNQNLRRQQSQQQQQQQQQYSQQQRSSSTKQRN